MDNNKKSCTSKLALTAKHIKMIYDIRSLTEKYENLFGVNENGEVGTLPNSMFIMLLEDELFQLKERLGIPLFVCPHCDKPVDDALELETGGINDYMLYMLNTAKESVEYFKKNGVIKKKDRVVPE